METVRTIKEKSCYVALNPAKEEKELLASSSAAAAAGTSSKGGAGGDSRIAGGGRSGVDEFRLPDGRVIKVSRGDSKEGDERETRELTSSPFFLSIYRFSARLRALQSSRNPLQPGTDRSGIRRSTSTRRGFHQSSGSRSEKESVLERRAVWRNDALQRFVLLSTLSLPRYCIC